MTNSSDIMDFKKTKTDEVIVYLKSNSVYGLDDQAIEKKLKVTGYNEIKEKKQSLILLFVKRFWGISAWMIELIILVSWFLQKYNDIYIISSLLFLNALIGFFEEKKASDAVEMLKQKLQINSKVLRNEKWINIAARELVPGDILRLRSGDFVPADVKIISGDVSVDQSALTGESMDVEAAESSLIYAGSTIRRGEINGIVVLTGSKTYFGKTLDLIQIAKPKLHIDEISSQITLWLLVIIGVLIALLIGFAFLKGINILGLLPLVLVLLLSAIPVALPTMFTVSMAFGSMQLAKKGIIVTRLSATEDAADMDILCTDKTGTLTMNKPEIAEIIPFTGYTDRDVILFGALASTEANQDPLDKAFLNEVRTKKLSTNGFIQKEFKPFDAKIRRTEATINDGTKNFVVTKGAVDALSNLSGVDFQSETIKKILKTVEQFTQKGQRAIAVAKYNEQGKSEMVGIATFYDPPRPDTKELIKSLKDLGISIKLLSGDAFNTVGEFARNVGIGGNIIRASEFKKIAQEDLKKAAEIAEQCDGFAEVYPEDKFLIVKSLQAKNHVVGMTGDGVNDAPSLKQAEVGIAVSGATDVAKGSASAVLTRQGLSDIVELIMTGRMIFQRVTTWILNKVTKTILNSFLAVLVFIIFGNDIITASIMLLLIFMIDFVTISLATDNVRTSKSPNIWNIAALAKLAGILGIMAVIESLLVVSLGTTLFPAQINIQNLPTVAFEILLFFQIFSLFVVRAKDHFWSLMPGKTMLSAMAADILIAMIIATFGLIGFKPISLMSTGFILIFGLAFVLFVNDFVKVHFIKKLGILR